MMSARSYLVSRQSQRTTSQAQQPLPQPQPQPQQRPPLAVISKPSLPAPSSRTTFTNDDNARYPQDTSVPIASSSFSIPNMPSRRREPSTVSQTLSPPGTTTIVSRPNTPSTPVQIPQRPRSRDTLRPQKPYRHHGGRRHHSERSKEAHTPDAIPASVAALLAITSIPPPKQARGVRQTKMEKRMTVESIIERAQESEKELSLSLCKSPLDLLLMSPEDLEADDASFCDSAMGSVFSTRTVSLESMPSLCNSYATDTLSSMGSPHTPSRRRSIRPTRRPLTPVSSPPGKVDEFEHPLSSPVLPVEELDFRVFDGEKEALSDKKVSPFKPLKSAFKSNLTASLRALRQAARSFSNLNFTSIPPEDFLTRSILTIDPQVPYTDERRPPLLEEEPTAALRRYLNPTSTTRLEQPQASVTAGPALRTFTASIQMQTYKVHRARSGGNSGRPGYPSVGPSSGTHTAQASKTKPSVTEYPMPGPRQREMRENPDFIRIAVMEMAMRKRGKLDDQRPGRARWALPPRKPSTKPYVVGSDGVPARWVPVCH
ncbi:hypothetical protein QBC35DRAFT_79338 [Podospora australis]|uniref:Uncharacterized protein n=1 Tax=Podospora australis TaxID=1536484 RepID=A0AAN6WZ88_9PEZI|nr:hypothetical protein QBC35DRAFT_79338 [Podospora australis]